MSYLGLRGKRAGGRPGYCQTDKLGVFCPDLWMKYRIFISIVHILANLESIDIDNAILENIDIAIDIDKDNLGNVNIDKGLS